MMRIVQRSGILSIAGLSVLMADTITTQDSLSVNGSLTQANPHTITFVARFASGDIPYDIDPANVKIIEFNSVTFNAGAPPKAVGLGPARPKSFEFEQTQLEQPDTIFIRGAQHRPCKLMGIDEQLVRCAGPTETLAERL